MPNISADTPREIKTIAGVSLSVPQPYIAGHTLDDVEARVMNQVFAENLGNNLRATFDEHREEGQWTEDWSDEKAQATLDEKASSYEWYKRGARASMDPVEKKARELAATAVKEALNKKGQTVDKEHMKSLVEGAFVKHNDIFMKRAKKLIEDAKKAAIEIDLDLAA